MINVKMRAVPSLARVDWVLAEVLREMAKTICCAWIHGISVLLGVRHWCKGPNSK